ncbi:hypothetical protein ES703_32310 [subsurface metagenome]
MQNAKSGEMHKPDLESFKNGATAENEKLGWSQKTISDDLESFSKNAKSAENTKPDPLRFTDVWSYISQERSAGSRDCEFCRYRPFSQFINRSRNDCTRAHGRWHDGTLCQKTKVLAQMATKQLAQRLCQLSLGASPTSGLSSRQPSLPLFSSFPRKTARHELPHYGVWKFKTKKSAELSPPLSIPPYYLFYGIGGTPLYPTGAISTPIFAPDPRHFPVSERVFREVCSPSPLSGECSAHLVRLSLSWMT